MYPVPGVGVNFGRAVATVGLDGPWVVTREVGPGPELRLLPRLPLTVVILLISAVATDMTDCSAMTVWMNMVSNSGLLGFLALDLCIFEDGNRTVDVDKGRPRVVFMSM